MRDDLIGLHVRYFDYLGLERFGTIIFSEPFQYDDSIRYVYIEDEEVEFNIHEDNFNGNIVKYAEIRLTTEVILDTE